MTALIATITPERGWLSQDTAGSLVTHADIAAMEAMAQFQSADEAIEQPSEKTMPPPDAGFEIDKLCALAAQRMIIGGAGMLAPYVAWRDAVEAAGFEIEELNERAAEIWRELPAAKRLPVVVIALGWSRAADRVLGFCASSSDGFVPRVLDSGHSITPTPSPEDIGYLEIEQQWTPAAHGVRTAAFHRLVALNQARSSRSGRYGGWARIGGELHTAIVTREGVEMHSAGELP